MDPQHDEERRGLCYEQHHVEAGTGTVTLPHKLPCVLRGRSYQEKLLYKSLVEKFSRKICLL
jgi:hypothetical protein